MLNPNITNLWELITFLFIPFFVLALITKIIIKTAMIYQTRINKKLLNLETNLVSDRLKVFLLQFILIIISQNISFLVPLNCWKIHFNFLLLNLLPVLSINALIQLILCFSFFNKSPKTIKVWNNIRSSLVIALIFSLICQFLMISWQIDYSLLKNGALPLIPLIYLTLIYLIYRFFNRDLTIIKLLIISTYTIILAKTNNNVNTFVNTTILNDVSKQQLITNLWTFDQQSLSQLKTLFLNKMKIVKSNLVIFLIACRNLCRNNPIKEQAIVINGWIIKVQE